MADRALGDELQRLIHFHSYQRAWLADKSRFKAGMFSRQTGKTFTSCAELVDDCVEAELTGKRTRWVILSRGERQAMEAMTENVKPMTRAFWALYNGLKGNAPDVFEGDWRSEETGASYRTFEVEFPGGSRITALPANPDTARGFSANALLDEFAFHKDSKAIWGALFPVISKGWKLRVISTPNGKSNKFYEIMTANPSIWSRHMVDIYQAVAAGLERNIDELRAGMSDADLWAQEFELKWLDEATAWLDFDLINSCETDGYGFFRLIEYTGGKITNLEEKGAPVLPTNGEVFVGMDIARKKDLTCIWVAVRLGDTLYPREIITMRRAPFQAQMEELARVVNRDRASRVSIDETGMGGPFVEQAQRLLGQHRVEGVTFTAPSKFALASMLKDSMEDRRFRIPAGDMLLRDDLHSITKAVSATGVVRLVHDGESDGHGDRFWAGALCVNAASGEIQQIAYQSVPKPTWDQRHSGDDTPRGMIERASAAQIARFGKGAW